MALTDATCPNCGTDLKDCDDSADGFLTFYHSPVDMGDRAEGHFGCPECGDPIYVDAKLRSVEQD